MVITILKENGYPPKFVTTLNRFRNECSLTDKKKEVFIDLPFEVDDVNDMIQKRLNSSSTGPHNYTNLMAYVRTTSMLHPSARLSKSFLNA